MTLTDRLATAVDRSRLLGAIGRAVRGARLYARSEPYLPGRTRPLSAARRWAESSSFAHWSRSVTGAISRWSDDARITAAAATIGRWARTSFLYRWLTAEPEPEVVEIDLRETLTVGPILVVLDRTVRTLEQAAPTSTVRSLAADVTRRIRDAPIRVASLVVIVALVTETIVSGLLGNFDRTGFGIRLVLAAVALVGVRIELSWNELRDTRPVRLLVAALEPPPSPESSPRPEHEEETDDDE
jgi:hypothetical protein